MAALNASPSPNESKVGTSRTAGALLDSEEGVPPSETSPPAVQEASSKDKSRKAANLVGFVFMIVSLSHYAARI